MTRAEVNFLHFSCTEEEEEERKKKNCEQPKHFPPHFGGSRYPRAYPFKFEEKHFRKNDLVRFFFCFFFSFSLLSLRCLVVINTGVRCRRFPLAPKPKKCRSRRRKSLCLKRRVYGRAANPTLGAFRRERVEKDSGGE